VGSFEGYTKQEKSDYLSSLLGPRTLELLKVERPDDIHLIQDWRRGGAETYVTVFEVGGRKLIAKACIKLPPGEVVREWLERRRIMSENGVVFPEVIAVDSATIIEEFIPLEFIQAYKFADEGEREQLENGFLCTYKRIYGSGFSPTSLHDLRSHGDDVVVVDVGEDIGGYVCRNASDISVAIKAEKSLRDAIRHV